MDPELGRDKYELKQPLKSAKGKWKYQLDQNSGNQTLKASISGSRPSSPDI